MIKEDELIITRRYIGVFIDFRATPPEKFGGPALIWIKINNADHGKISAYSRKCDFIAGERLYIHRVYIKTGGAFGYWIYQIEGDTSEKTYRLSEFQYDNKVLVQTWF